ncbi:MAG: class I SAM-dependent methyltransferase [bacterium]|nr:class I SAM-dependent methyltransferase [bacterium]
MTRVVEKEDWYKELDSSYKNPKSLMAKKMAIIQDLIKGSKLLDVGSGSGELISRLAGKMDKVVGVEVNKNAYSGLKEKIKKFKNTSIFESLDKVEENNFDVCTTLDVLEHIEDPSETVEEIYSKLKKGGTYIVTIPNWYDFIYTKILKLNPYHVTFHTRYGWEKLLKEAGFEIESVRSIKWPLLSNDFLAKKLPFWGMCLVIVCKKK